MTEQLHRSAGAREVGGLDVVAALRHGRRIARLSQRDLARRAGVSQSSIARIEARRVDPPVGLMQRLLGLCCLTWDLRVTPAGATPARARAGALDVRELARRRAEVSAAGRRASENAAARAMAGAVAGAMLTFRERRAEVKAARLAERASQVAAAADLVRHDDNRTRQWLAEDLTTAERLLGRRCGRLQIPLADRLPGQLARCAQDDVLRLLEDLSDWCSHPPVALTGSTARAVWTPAPVKPSEIDVDLAPLGSRERALDYLRELGAVRDSGRDMFDLARLTLRLRQAPPPSTALVRWRPGSNSQALAVARPEGPPGIGVGRHDMRAVLESARRDGRGRRYPPYQEVMDNVVAPVWFEPGAKRTIVRP